MLIRGFSNLAVHVKKHLFTCVSFCWRAYPTKLQLARRCSGGSLRSLKYEDWSHKTAESQKAQCNACLVPGHATCSFLRGTSSLRCKQWSQATNLAQSEMADWPLLSKRCISHHIFEIFCWSSEHLTFPHETKPFETMKLKKHLRTWLARLGHFQPTVAARLRISKVEVERSFPRSTNRFWENDAPIVPSVYSPFSAKAITSTRAPVANSCLHEFLLQGKGTWVNGK